MFKAVADDDAWTKWNRLPFARTRGSIANEAGKIQGRAGFSVKHLPISSLPTDRDSPIINDVCQDVLHMRLRISERMVNEAIKESATFTGDKLSQGFQAVIRQTGVPFRIYETSIRGRAQVCFSSLTGRHWRKLLNGISSALRLSSGDMEIEGSIIVRG